MGPGWGGLTNFGGGDGIVYAIVKGTGELRWYRHKSPLEGERIWQGPEVVGRGWSTMRAVVGLGSGVIYAVDADGRLLQYQHQGYLNGSALWANGGRAVEIGSGWSSYDRMTANPEACLTEDVVYGDDLTEDCEPLFAPNLRSKYFNVSRQSVHIDAYGRPDLAFIGFGVNSKLVPGSDNTKCTTKVGHWGRPGDHGGHLIGRQLGGWHLRGNVVPQDRNLNTLASGHTGSRVRQPAVSRSAIRSTTACLPTIAERSTFARSP